MSAAPGLSWLYLHGFASGPSSAKAQAFQRWGAARGVSIDALDLRLPSLEHLRFSAITKRVRSAIDEGGELASRAVLIGSSLGGLAACRVAAEDPRVCAVLAMAPAFRLAARWRAKLGEEAWESWREDGGLEVDDHATNQRARVHFAFVEELEQLERDLPDVRVPVLIVHGQKDDVVDIAHSREWATGKRHVRLLEVDDGHDLLASIPRILQEAAAFFAPMLGPSRGP